ncbi:MAG: hypothetical protein C0402_13965 [Thermodesulfovibrio sp.]|nr:hypothetical protein [Thermodesulfovibrio sp.]
MSERFSPPVRGNEKRMDAEDVILPHYSPPILCPFVSRPFEDCYCASTSSMVVESTILFCGGDFKKCEIYCRYKGTA